MGYSEGMVALGELHEKGSQGVTQSDQVAVAHYAAAANLGDAEGLFKLGCMFVQVNL